MGKSKVTKSSSKQFISAGGKVNVSHPAVATKPGGKGLGTPGSSAGKQTSRAAKAC